MRQYTPTLRIGLTGGIGSGKSTVALQFAALGAVVVDADAISHQLTSPGGVALDAIRQKFGNTYLHSDGGLDRPRMRELVFTHSDKRIELERIIHPMISNEMQRQYEKAVAMGVKYVIYDMPLLAEAAYWRKNLDKILVVDCTLETQVSRVLARGSKLAMNSNKPLTREFVNKIIASQASREIRLKLADVIIFNECNSLTLLNSEICQLAKEIGLSASP